MLTRKDHVMLVLPHGKMNPQSSIHLRNFSTGRLSKGPFSPDKQTHMTLVRSTRENTLAFFAMSKNGLAPDVGY